MIATIAVLAFAALAWPAVRAHLQAVAVLDLVGNKPVPTPLHWLVAQAARGHGGSKSDQPRLVHAEVMRTVQHDEHFFGLILQAAESR